MLVGDERLAAFATVDRLALWRSCPRLDLAAKWTSNEHDRARAAAAENDHDALRALRSSTSQNAGRKRTAASKHATSPTTAMRPRLRMAWLCDRKRAT